MLRAAAFVLPRVVAAGGMPMARGLLMLPVLLLLLLLLVLKIMCCNAVSVQLCSCKAQEEGLMASWLCVSLWWQVRVAWELGLRSKGPRIRRG